MSVGYKTLCKKKASKLEFNLLEDEHEHEHICAEFSNCTVEYGTLRCVVEKHVEIQTISCG